MANRLAHTKWVCKYHIAFTPKYRRKVIYNSIKADIREIIRFGNRHFWAEGYYVSTVGLNKATIRKYIREQETHDQMTDKITTKELEDPFKGPAK